MNFQNVINSLDDGVLVVDKEGRIQYCNDAYSKFIDRPLDEIKGVHLNDIRPGAMMPGVIKQGKKVSCTLRSEYGQQYFASIYPIYENGELTGGVSIVTILEHAKYFAATLKSLKQKEYYLKNMMSAANGTRYTFDNIICGSEVSARCIESAKRIAKTNSHILLQGESGCGKEVYAQAIHNESERRGYPFVAINCAALNRDLLESELFGYAPGAFTGAKKEGKPGLFEAAKHGTLFLDEVSEMDLPLQAKLLRALQEKKIRRVGATEEVEIDVQIISACNVNLLRYIEEKKFRMDLYYRLAVMPLQIPPLRERRDDIRLLAEAHLKNISIQKKQIISISDAAMNALYNYDWPGNVRELNNVLEYTAMMCEGGEIQLEDLPISIRSAGPSSPKNQTLAELVKEFEQREIRNAISKYGDTVSGKKAAAEHLGISLASLYNKLGKK